MLPVPLLRNTGVAVTARSHCTSSCIADIFHSYIGSDGLICKWIVTTCTANTGHLLHTDSHKYIKEHWTRSSSGKERFSQSVQDASFKKSISDSIKEVGAGIWIFCTCLERVLSLTRAGQPQKSDAKDDTGAVHRSGNQYTAELSQLSSQCIELHGKLSYTRG